ncbi:MAG TPA: GTP-binding protein, partial [Terracidiphilus sp.]|nr:GTP-binding protein [Terracidiphilus sp.]
MITEEDVLPESLKVVGDDIDAQIEAHLRADRAKDLLRFSTAGSVDDGKSTLIGRLLYDSRNVYDDHIRSVTHNAAIDFAQLTDGLRAEREQGITIDVAYRYAATPTRKFIIADCPGHVQYTRNMATGASTADLALAVVDTTAGLKEQTRRHLCIAALLGVRRVIVAANKMDLAEWAKDPYQALAADVAELAARLGIESPLVVPVSALNGDNVVEHSDAAPWYDGPSVLEALESAPAGGW